MPPLSKSEQAEILNEISQSLLKTSYACSTLTQLGGGTVSFIYRGALATALGDGSKSIIVKKAPNHVASNRDFPLDAGRSVFEAAMLQSLSTLRSSNPTEDQIMVKTPELYNFVSSTHTQILQDFPTSLDIKSLLMSPISYSVFTKKLSASIGRATGSWLRNFHNWSSAPEQVDLRRFVKGNEAMQKLKFDVTYGGFINVLSNFPDILGDKREVLKSIAEFVKKESEEKNNYNEWGVIHGDFWGGNVLLSPESIAPSKKPELQVIDFEFAQLGHPSHDLGQMIGDLIERNHFHDLDSALWILDGFLEGFGEMSEELAFRTAIHAGIHLICVYTRRPPKGPVKGTKEQIEGAMRIGLEFISKGWGKKRGWFEESILKSLFVDGQKR